MWWPHYEIVAVQIVFVLLFALASHFKWVEWLRWTFMGIAFLIQVVLGWMLFHPRRSNLKDKANGK
jgi:hypothetical protein